MILKMLNRIFLFGMNLLLTDNTLVNFTPVPLQTWQNIWPHKFSKDKYKDKNYKKGTEIDLSRPTWRGIQSFPPHETPEATQSHMV